MILPDLNLLFYAYNPTIPEYEPAAGWWLEVLNSDELIALPHEVLFGFLRIATHPRLREAAVSLAKAKNTVDTWLAHPRARLVLADPDHYARVLRLMKESKSKGAILADAILASYAIPLRATLCSNDQDFARFKELTWKNPLL